MINLEDCLVLVTILERFLFSMIFVSDLLFSHLFPSKELLMTTGHIHTIFESNSSVWTDLIYYTIRPRMFFSSNSNSRERLTCDMIFNVENQWIIGLPLLDQFNGKYEYTFWFIFQKEKCQKYSWYLSYCGIEKSLTTRYESLIFKCQN